VSSKEVFAIVLFSLFVHFIFTHLGTSPIANSALPALPTVLVMEYVTSTKQSPSVTVLMEQIQQLDATTRLFISLRK